MVDSVRLTEKGVSNRRGLGGFKGGANFMLNIISDKGGWEWVPVVTVFKEAEELAGLSESEAVELLRGLKRRDLVEYSWKVGKRGDEGYY